MLDAPKGLRLHIGLFGRRNVGKSSLLNALAAQSVSIVSDTPGTTTDPVEKTLEFAPLGPVVFLDTAGLDDEGELRLTPLASRTDMALVVTAETSGHYEETVSRLRNSVPCGHEQTESSVALRIYLMMRGLSWCALPRKRAKASKRPPRTGSAVAWRIASLAASGGSASREGVVISSSPDSGAPKGWLGKPSGMPFMDASYSLW
ncbi:MAG: GTPase [Bilophila wadsworthia]